MWNNLLHGFMSSCTVMGSLGLSRNLPWITGKRKSITESHMKVKVVAQLYPALYDPMDCGPPGSSIRGILQARIPEWIAISFSRGSSQSRDQTRSPDCTQFLYHLNHWRSPESHIMNVIIEVWLQHRNKVEHGFRP